MVLFLGLVFFCCPPPFLPRGNFVPTLLFRTLLKWKIGVNFMRIIKPKAFKLILTAIDTYIKAKVAKLSLATILPP